MSDPIKIIIKIVSFLALVSLFGGIIYFTGIADIIFPGEKIEVTLPSLKGGAEEDKSPCSINKIFYGVGTIDEDFGISKEKFTEAIKEAELIWESSLNADIFIDSSSINRIEISLIFDERQAETLGLKQILEGISSAEEKYEAVKKEYSGLSSEVALLADKISSQKAEYSLMEKSYLSALSYYEKKREAYEKEVAYWNSSGGAPRSEYERLEAEKAELAILYEEIIKEESRLKAFTEEINKEVASYNEFAGRVNMLAGILNRLAGSLNAGIVSYNRLAADREEFAAGTYRVEGGEKSINIYQFYDYQELVVIIAHEMGHALGLDHGTEENSIMYPKIKSQSGKLSEEDLFLLIGICK